MEKEVRITSYDGGGGVGGDDGADEVDERVLEWEAGLPDADDLTPLSQLLISSDLLSAFNITPEPYRSMIDVNRASENTFSDLRGELEQQSLTRFNSLKSFNDEKTDDIVMEGEEIPDLTSGGSNFPKIRNLASGGDGGVIEETDAGDSSARASKRPRLVWTPQLHKRFIEVVAHLGVKNAVPKTIMQLMNVEGLTRENVASHLQKYRLYLKRMQGISPRGLSSPDHLFASTPAPHNLHESTGGGGGGGNGYYHAPATVPIHHQQQMVRMPYPSPKMVPISAAGGGGGSSAVGGYHHGFDPNSYGYNMTMQQRDWYQHHRTLNDK